MSRVLAVAAAVGMVAAAQGAPRTGSISGTVLDSKSGEPVAKAVVFVQLDRVGPLGAISGGDGKFSIAEVPPGKYYLYIQRSGYAVTFDLRKEVTVAAGETTSDVVFKVAKTGVITGRVLDLDGDPAVNANVTAVAVGSKPGQYGGATSITDDRGQYRVHGIFPGDYKVSATYSPAGMWSNLRIAGSAKEGEPRLEYPAVFFPSTANESLASAVRVEPGAVVEGIDIRMMRVRSVRVRGRVQSSAAFPDYAVVSLRPLRRMDRPSAGREYSCPIDKRTGEFQFVGVVPGRYRASIGWRLGEPPRPILGSQLVQVDDTDVDGLEVLAAPMREISGRFLAPAGRKLPDRVVVGLIWRDPADLDTTGLPVGGTRDGSFALPQVGPGEYDVVVGWLQDSPGAGDLYVDSIRAGDDDVLANGLRVDAGPAAPIQIVVKANGGAIEVSVEDDREPRVANADVVLKPDSPRERHFALSRHCETGADGKCTISGIKPGSYRLYAFPEGSAEVNTRDPDALKPLARYAKSISIGEGERTSVSLKPVLLE